MSALPSRTERPETPDVSFHVASAAALSSAAAPTIGFGLRVEAAPGDVIRSIVLNTQIRITVLGRSYDARARERLAEIFGEPQGWAATASSLFWTRTVSHVPGFTGSRHFELPASASYDFDVATSKYFDALEDGEVPLEFLFSGTVFYASEQGALRTALVPWDRESRFRMPVEVWREAMDRHFPGTAWMRVPRETFDRLHRFKMRRGLLDWGTVIERLLDETGEEPAPEVRA